MLEVRFDDFYECLLEYYDRPKEIRVDRIRKGFNDLKVLEPIVNSDETTIDIIKEHENGEYCFDVSGLVKGDENRYSLVFTPWEGWLSYNISDSTIRSMSLTEILVHCYWEMTWKGWNNNEIQRNIEIDALEAEQCDNLEAEVEEIKRNFDFIEDTFIDRILELYRNARTGNLQAGIEIVIEELLDLQMLTKKQVMEIKSEVDDEDVTAAIIKYMKHFEIG